MDQGTNKGRKKMRTLLKDFMTDINKEKQEQGEALKAPSAGANRAEERRMRRLQTETRGEKRKRREGKEKTRRKRSEKEKKKRELEDTKLGERNRETRERKERQERSHCLGAKWTPRSKLSFSHAHLLVSNCLSLRPIVHLRGCLYLATNTATASIQHSKGTSLLMLLPLHVYHFLCDYSFNLQATDLTNCPSCFSYQFPLFHNAQFHFVPWQTVPALNDTMVLNSTFTIPQPLRLDNQTLQSLDET